MLMLFLPVKWCAFCRSQTCNAASIACGLDDVLMSAAAFETEASGKGRVAKVSLQDRSKRTIYYSRRYLSLDRIMRSEKASSCVEQK